MLYLVPTEQEVLLHLNELNRVTFMRADSPEAKRARAAMIQKSLQWFVNHTIVVYQGEHCQWVLSP